MFFDEARLHVDAQGRVTDSAFGLSPTVVETLLATFLPPACVPGGIADAASKTWQASLYNRTALLWLRCWRLRRCRSLRLPRRWLRRCGTRRRFRRRGSSRRSRLGRGLLLLRRLLRRLVIVHHGFLRRRNRNRRLRRLQIRPQPHNLRFLRRRQIFQPVGESLARALKTFQIVGQRLKIVLRSKRSRLLHHAPEHVI